IARSCYVGRVKRVALLRGVNVGGRNMLSKTALISIFGDVGCADVSTYIQSGNVLFDAPARLAARVPMLATAAIAERFGLDVAVVVRTHDELAAIARANPFAGAGADESRLAVMFLAEQPAPRAVAALDPARSPPD